MTDKSPKKRIRLSYHEEKIAELLANKMVKKYPIDTQIDLTTKTCVWTEVRKGILHNCQNDARHQKYCLVHMCNQCFIHAKSAIKNACKPCNGKTFYKKYVVEHCQYCSKDKIRYPFYNCCSIRCWQLAYPTWDEKKAGVGCWECGCPNGPARNQCDTNCNLK